MSPQMPRYGCGAQNKKSPISLEKGKWFSWFFYTVSHWRILQIDYISFVRSGQACPDMSPIISGKSWVIVLIFFFCMQSEKCRSYKMITSLKLGVVRHVCMHKVFRNKLLIFPEIAEWLSWVFAFSKTSMETANWSSRFRWV